MEKISYVYEQMNEIHDLSSTDFKTYLVSTSSMPEFVLGAGEEKINETESLLQGENMLNIMWLSAKTGESGVIMSPQSISCRDK